MTQTAPEDDHSWLPDLPPEIKEIVPFFLAISLSIKHGDYLKAQELISAALEKYSKE